MSRPWEDKLHCGRRTYQEVRRHELTSDGKDVLDGESELGLVGLMPVSAAADDVTYMVIDNLEPFQIHTPDNPHRGGLVTEIVRYGGAL